MGKKIIISSVSASGKTTLVNELLKQYPDIYRLKTCTSREARSDETGDEYYFMTSEEMNLKHVCGEFIETSIVYTNTYGLTKDEVKSHQDNDVIVILDVNGMKKFKKIYPDAITVFIEPPPVQELISRLISRDTNESDVRFRIANMKQELKAIKKYDYLVKYDSLDNMISSFFALIENIISDN